MRRSTVRRSTTVVTFAVAILTALTSTGVAPAHAGDGVAGGGPTATMSLTPTSGTAPLVVTLQLDDVGTGDTAAVGGIVSWSDGSADSPLVADGPDGTLRATQVYEHGGWYPVIVRVHDASGTWSPWLEAGAVEVEGPSKPPDVPPGDDCPGGPACGWPFPNDSTGPELSIQRPAKAKRTRAATWRTLKGVVSDAGSGPVAATAGAVVRTSRGWSYLAGERWRTASTKAEALSRSRRLTDETVTSGRWRVRLPAAPPRGVIHVHAWAVDLAANTSAQALLKQRLTR